MHKPLPSFWCNPWRPFGGRSGCFRAIAIMVLIYKVVIPQCCCMSSLRYESSMERNWGVMEQWDIVTVQSWGQKECRKLEKMLGGKG